YTALAGTYAIGTAQVFPTGFPTLKQALDSLEVLGMSAPVIFNILNNLTESLPLQIQGPILGSSAANTLTIKPNTTGITITINHTQNYGLQIAGASNIIIDGNPSGGSGVSATNMTWLSGTAASTTQNSQQIVLQPALSLTDGTPLSVSNVIVRNMNLRGAYVPANAVPTSLTQYGVF